MITIKTEEEIKIMEEGGIILASVLELLKKSIKPGLKTIELDRIFNRFCLKHNCRPAFKNYGAYGKNPGFPYSICVSINEQVVHGTPGEREIKEGDIVSVDAGITYRGFITDSAFTVAVGKVDLRTQKLLEMTEKSMYKGIEQVKAGAKVGDISFVIGELIKANDMEVFKSLAGHGVGKELHEDPLIPNFGKKGEGETLEAGMTLAIETMVSLGSGEMKEASDGWTLSSVDNSLTAHFEHTVLVTNSGYKILTTLH